MCVNHSAGYKFLNYFENTFPHNSWIKRSLHAEQNGQNWFFPEHTFRVSPKKAIYTFPIQNELLKRHVDNLDILLLYFWYSEKHDDKVGK